MTTECLVLQPYWNPPLSSGKADIIYKQIRKKKETEETIYPTVQISTA